LENTRKDGQARFVSSICHCLIANAALATNLCLKPRIFRPTARHNTDDSAKIVKVDIGARLGMLVQKHAYR